MRASLIAAAIAAWLHQLTGLIDSGELVEGHGAGWFGGRHRRCAGVLTRARRLWLVAGLVRAFTVSGCAGQAACSSPVMATATPRAFRAWRWVRIFLSRLVRQACQSGPRSR